MSFEKKQDDDLEQSASRPKNVEEAVGSHYALQIALQTMKERCQHLQKRLGILEQENLRLRIENRKRKPEAGEVRSSTDDQQSKIDSLEEKIAELTRTKSQLTHHLFMVATENKQLWNRLSSLTQANQNLGNHLSKISNTLSRHHSTSSIVLSKSQSPVNSLSQSKENNECPDADKEPSSPFGKAIEEESLEEISLKLIRSFLQEKTELEEQYAQMVEIQNDSFSIQNLGFASLEDGDEEMEDVKQHHKNLVELRDMMQQQQAALKCALTNLERGIKGGTVCSSCRDKKPENDAEIEAEMESLRKWGMSAEVPTERICPMCGKLYDKAVPFGTFHEHVSNHFTDDDDAFSIINSDEVVT